MNVLAFAFAGCLTSIFAAILGALAGPGGGVITVPVLSLLFKVDLRYATGASLIP
jgi:uncharacterized protein